MSLLALNSSHSLTISLLSNFEDGLFADFCQVFVVGHSFLLKCHLNTFWNEGNLDQAYLCLVEIENMQTMGKSLNTSQYNI